MKQPRRTGLTRRIVLALALCLAAAAPVPAGLDKGSGELGFDFGVADLDTEFIHDVGGGVTFRGGYFLTDLVEIEGQIAGYGATNLYSSNVALRTVMVDAVFNFRPNRIVMPYVLVGGGRAEMDYDRWFDALPGPSADDDSIAFQAGAGSRFFFGKAQRFAVRLEATFLREETFEESTAHERFTFGFSFKLGR
jgi:opacity protein-like surface antigen